MGSIASGLFILVGVVVCWSSIVGTTASHNSLQSRFVGEWVNSVSVSLSFGLYLSIVEAVVVGTQEVWREPEQPTSLLSLQRTWKPDVAGLLDIMVGSVMTLTSLLQGWVDIGYLISYSPSLAFTPYPPILDLYEALYPVQVISKVVVSIVVSLLVIKGGIHAFQRKKWRWALAGSACAAFVGLGIPTVILIGLSKKEFGYIQNTSLKKWAFLIVVLLLILAVAVKTALWLWHIRWLVGWPF